MNTTSSQNLDVIIVDEKDPIEIDHLRRSPWIGKHSKVNISLREDSAFEF